MSFFLLGGNYCFGTHLLFPAWTFWQHDDDEDGDDDGDDADTDSDVDDDGLKFLKTFGSEKFHSWKVWQRQQTNYSQ